MWPQQLDHTREECLGILRELEVKAFSAVVDALRASGDLTDAKSSLLEELASQLSISKERQRTEIRRSVNSELLATVSHRVSGLDNSDGWKREGRRVIPILPRSRPITGYTDIADAASLDIKSLNNTLPLPANTRTTRPPPPLPALAQKHLVSSPPPSPTKVAKDELFLKPEKPASLSMVNGRLSPDKIKTEVKSSSCSDDDLSQFVVLPSGMAVRLKEEKTPVPAGASNGSRRGSSKRKRSSSVTTKSIEIYPGGVPSVLGIADSRGKPPGTVGRRSSASSPPRKFGSAATSMSPVHQAGHGYARPPPLSPSSVSSDPLNNKPQSPARQSPGSAAGVQSKSAQLFSPPVAKRGPGRPPGPSSPSGRGRARGPRGPRTRGSRGGGRGSRGGGQRGGGQQQQHHQLHNSLGGSQAAVASTTNSQLLNFHSQPFNLISSSPTVNYLNSSSTLNSQSSNNLVNPQTITVPMIINHPPLVQVSNSGQSEYNSQEGAPASNSHQHFMVTSSAASSLPSTFATTSNNSQLAQLSAIAASQLSQLTAAGSTTSSSQLAQHPAAPHSFVSQQTGGVVGGGGVFVRGMRAVAPRLPGVQHKDAATASILSASSAQPPASGDYSILYNSTSAKNSSGAQLLPASSNYGQTSSTTTLTINTLSAQQLSQLQQQVSHQMAGQFSTGLGQGLRVISHPHPASSTSAAKMVPKSSTSTVYVVPGYGQQQQRQIVSAASGQQRVVTVSSTGQRFTLAPAGSNIVNAANLTGVANRGLAVGSVSSSVVPGVIRTIRTAGLVPASSPANKSSVIVVQKAAPAGIGLHQPAGAHITPTFQRTTAVRPATVALYRPARAVPSAVSRGAGSSVVGGGVVRLSQTRPTLVRQVHSQQHGQANGNVILLDLSQQDRPTQLSTVSQPGGPGLPAKGAQESSEDLTGSAKSLNPQMQLLKQVVNLATNNKDKEEEESGRVVSTGNVLVNNISQSTLSKKLCEPEPEDVVAGDKVEAKEDNSKDSAAVEAKDGIDPLLGASLAVGGDGAKVKSTILSSETQQQEVSNAAGSTETEHSKVLQTTDPSSVISNSDSTSISASGSIATTLSATSGKFVTLPQRSEGEFPSNSLRCGGKTTEETKAPAIIPATVTLTATSTSTRHKDSDATMAPTGAVQSTERPMGSSGLDKNPISEDPVGTLARNGKSPAASVEDEEQHTEETLDEITEFFASPCIMTEEDGGSKDVN